MTLTAAVAWIVYAIVLLSISRWAKSSNALLPGRVSYIVQAFAYMATYISAVALVGFGGLCHKFGLQMMLVAAGNAWLGTWFVYKFLAWPTRLYQRKYSAHTPAQLLSRAYESPKLRVFLGTITAVLLIVYGSAVFKGAALMISGVLPISVNTSLIILIAIVGVSVMVGGLRGVLYTEGLQGMIMVVGVMAMLFAILKHLGGPLEGLRQLGELAPNADANNGFLAFSSGAPGVNILSLTVVTSIGIWAQPQLIQRHFALSSRAEAMRVTPLAMLAIVVVVGGMYFGGALSRLLLDPSIKDPDIVIPTLVGMLLPEAGQQIFALAIVSASLSTASGLLHIASGSLWSDVLRLADSGERKSKLSWRLLVLGSVICCGVFAMKSSSIISMICTTSWSLLASAALVPYLAMLALGPRMSPRTALVSSVLGFVGCLGWYAIGYGPTAKMMTGISLGDALGMVPPIVVGTAVSLICAAPDLIAKKK